MERVAAVVGPICDRGCGSSGARGGILLPKRVGSGAQQRRDVVLQSVDVQPAGQDKRPLDSLFQDGGPVKKTGQIY